MVIVSDFRTEQAKDSKEKCAAVEGGLWDIEPWISMHVPATYSPAGRDRDE